MQSYMNSLSNARAGASDYQYRAQVDASGMVQPSPALDRALNEGFMSSTEVAVSQMGIGQLDLRANAREQALENITAFYRMRMFPKANESYLNPAAFGRASAQDQATLRRQNSFLSIKQPLNDIDALTRRSTGRPLTYIDSDTVKVLEEAVKAAQLLPAALREAAVARAKAGERCLPLSLDTPRMNAFLADNEAALTQVIQACAGGVGNAQWLAPPLRKLATDYLQRTDRLPLGLKPGTPCDYRGTPLSIDPISLLVNEFEFTEMELLADTQALRDKLVLSLGSEAVSGPMARYDSLIPGFASRPPAEKRAAVLLQSLFQHLTYAEERVESRGFHARTGSACRPTAGTKAELDYAGSLRIGDATTIDQNGQSQRLVAVEALQALAFRTTHEREIGALPKVTDPALRNWLTSARFHDDVNDIVTTGTRLGSAQIASTAAALLQSHAFGGAGLR